ncbi:hypothetical protein K1W54_04480 [Micromonospora sp. CPCC 205371]|nr:hypothetical protein [Micromonospora sp. CPCC 205371]
MVSLDHEPNPRWDCKGCGKDWPCDPAREALLAEYRNQPGQLAMTMCKLMEDATTVLGQHPDDMFERFIAWTKPVPLDVQHPS